MVGECVVEAGCFDEEDFGRFLEGCAAASMEASTGGVDPASANRCVAGRARAAMKVYK